MRRFSLTPYLLLAPGFALLVAFTHFPAILAFWQSLFTTPRGRRPAQWAGADNYLAMLDDPVLAKVLWNSALYAAATVPAAIALAFLMALWVNGRMPGRAFARLAFFTPTILPMVAAANIWLFFYTPGFGLLDQLLHGAFGLPSTNWLGSDATALWAVVVVAVWKEAGFFMIFYLAAFQAVPPALAEAARLEGCGRWSYVRRVLIPLVAPTTLFVAVNALINAFRVVDHIFAMTGGGPNNATNLLLFHIWEVGFRFWDTAQASALTVLLLAILGVAAAVQFRLMDRGTHYR
ncbi:carbohydrate ABC transporter permease [Rubrimonas sp.]|uniref:carbohydrate ABC transporter permease n=1 Tax=Rubrimonas sp. TaxID=2036015 RepID=UPI002FDCB7AA